MRARSTPPLRGYVTHVYRYYVLDLRAKKPSTKQGQEEGDDSICTGRDSYLRVYICESFTKQQVGARAEWAKILSDSLVVGAG
jgi:hypothetical protein